MGLFGGLAHVAGAASRGHLKGEIEGEDLRQRLVLAAQERLRRAESDKRSANADVRAQRAEERAEERAHRDEKRADVDLTIRQRQAAQPQAPVRGTSAYEDALRRETEIREGIEARHRPPRQPRAGDGPTTAGRAAYRRTRVRQLMQQQGRRLAMPEADALRQADREYDASFTESAPATPSASMQPASPPAADGGAVDRAKVSALLQAIRSGEASAADIDAASGLTAAEKAEIRRRLGR
jgi:hypothetical protein